VHIAQSFSGPTAHLVDDFVEDRELPVLHQVLLGIERNMGSLEDYLAGLGQAPLPPEIIDASDACGQTALAWAVEYGWPEATQVLLHYGASARRPFSSLSVTVCSIVCHPPHQSKGPFSSNRDLYLVFLVETDY
jgi:hypothetical protein